MTNLIQRILDKFWFFEYGMSPDEVAAALNVRASKQSEKLDWGHSIVDLMKLLKLDSGLKARKTLAKELGYKGDFDGSAKANTWLHQRVIEKVAERGIKIPT